MSRSGLSSLQRAFLGIATFMLIVAALRYARVVFIPVVTAVLLTFILSPLVSWLQRRGLGRIIAVAVVVTLVTLILGGMLFAFFAQVGQLATDLPQYKDQIFSRIDDLRAMMGGSWIEGLIETGEELIHAARPRTPQEPIPVRVEQSPFPLFQAIAGSALEFLVQAGLVLLLVVFMLVQREDFRNRLISLCGDDNLTTSTKALDDASHRISRYLLMQVIINVTYGIALGIGLWLIGVPYWFVWGFLSAILRYIPYLGPWIAAVFPILMSLAVLPGWTPVLLTCGYVAVLELISNNFMEPILYGRTTGISELALLVAVAFWTWLWGPLGMVLATPITTCLVVLGRHVSRLRFFSTLLGDRPVLEHHVALYQRLLARDQDEAADLIEKELQTQPLEKIYDGLLVPALVVARKDEDRGALSAREFRQVVATLQEVVLDAVVPQQEAFWATEIGKKDKDEEAPHPRPLVLALPRQKADEVVLDMFRGFMDRAAVRIRMLTTRTPPEHLFGLIRKHQPTAILIGTLPSSRLSQTRYLCRRIRVEFPDLKIVVACWGAEEEPEAVRRRLIAAGASLVGLTFQETGDNLLSLLRDANQENQLATAE